MRCSKNSESVIAILEALTESGTLRSEQRRDIIKSLKNFRKSLRARNRRKVVNSVEEISRAVVGILRNRGVH